MSTASATAQPHESIRTGTFSSDRAIREHGETIWGTRTVPIVTED